MKNGGYSALGSSLVLISEQGFLFPPLAHVLLWAKGGYHNLFLRPFPFLFHLRSIGTGGGICVPHRQKMSFGSGHNINKWGGILKLCPPTQLCMFWSLMTNGSIVQKSDAPEKKLEEER